MKVLITGATGLVGKEIVSELHKKGYSIHYLTTRKNRLKSTDSLRGFLWNPKKGKIDLKCFDGVNAIINLAGAPIAKRWTRTHKKNVLDSRVNSLQTLRSGLSKVDCSQLKYFVSASAIGIYPSSQNTFYEENCKDIDDGFLGSVVEQWEKEVDTLSILDLRLAKVRIGLVLSANGGALPQIAKPVNMLVGAPLGTGNQWQSWIHINDLARLFTYLIENNLEGVYNGVAPNPVTNKKLTKEVAAVLNRPLWMPNIPRFALKILLGKMSCLLLASQRVSSKKIQEQGFEFQFSNVCQALIGLYENRDKEKLSHEISNEEYA